jgi:hypothetical protein
VLVWFAAADAVLNAVDAAEFVHPLLLDQQVQRAIHRGEPQAVSVLAQFD